MFNRDRLAHTRTTVANAAAVGVLAFGAAVAFAATAAADDDDAPPAPPPPLLAAGAPAPPPPAEDGPMAPMLGPLGSTGLSVLAQRGQAPAEQRGTLGAPSVVGLDQASILGQNPTPLAPNSPATPNGTGVVPNLNVFNNAYGIQQHEVPSAPGGKQFGVPEGQENDDVTRRQWFGRYIDMQRDGRTRGGLGQAPRTQLGEPLPGTAPPPGTNIPPGLAENFPSGEYTGQLPPAPAPAPEPPPAP